MPVDNVDWHFFVLIIPSLLNGYQKQPKPNTQANQLIHIGKAKIKLVI
jgi:hypothetical protein